MRGIHTFRRDRTTQVISCNPWSTRLHPYPSLIRMMKMYLQVEGKHGPQPQSQSQPHTSTPSHDRNSSPRKPSVPKKVEKKRRAKAPVKRRFKVRVIILPMTHQPHFSSEPNPDCWTYFYISYFNSNIPNASGKSSSHIIPVTVYNLAQVKFEGIPNPTGKPQEEENSSTPSCNVPQERQQPAPAAQQDREDTLWPNTIPASINLFDARESWPIPPTGVPHSH